MASWPVGSSYAFWTTVTVLTYRIEDPPFLAVLLKTFVLHVVCCPGPSPHFPLPSSHLRTSLVAQRLRISFHRGYGFNPCEKIPYAVEQLIPCGPQLQTLTLEPESHDHPGLEPVIHKNRSHRSGKPVHIATKSSVKYLPQLEKACIQQ